jgi:hypothetical protein
MIHDSYGTSNLTVAMDQSPDPEFATTAISLEEQMRGWSQGAGNFSYRRRQKI